MEKRKEVSRSDTGFSIGKTPIRATKAPAGALKNSSVPARPVIDPADVVVP